MRRRLVPILGMTFRRCLFLTVCFFPALCLATPESSSSGESPAASMAQTKAANPKASSTRTGLEFGFPNLFGLRLDRPLSGNWRVGLSFGMLPMFLVTPFVRLTLNQDISDDYNVVVDPALQAFAAGFFTEWQPTPGHSFLRLELVANVVDVAAHTYIANKSTGSSAPYFDLEVMVAMPRLVASYGVLLSKNETWNLNGGVGVTLLLAKQVFVQHTGPASAYFNALPSLQGSLQDGIAQAQSEISSILSTSLVGATLLPALWISASW